MQTSINKTQLREPSVQEISGTEVSLSIEGNIRYQCTSALTSLTIMALTNSTLESVVEFTVGESFTLTLAEGVQYLGTLPEQYLAGEKYVIAVLYGTATMTRINIAE